MGETIQPKSLLQGFCAAFADSLIIGHYGGGIGTSPFESKLIYSNEEGKATDSISNFSRNIPTITPNDIASISVFKGGSGKEAFGMLGYNGLIYITYKDNKKVSSTQSPYHMEQRRCSSLQRSTERYYIYHQWKYHAALSYIQYRQMDFPGR